MELDDHASQQVANQGELNHYKEELRQKYLSEVKRISDDAAMQIQAS